MFVDWPEGSKSAFGREIVCAQHNISKSNLFDDDGLAYLLDVFPREKLDIWTFGKQREGHNTALRGRAPKMSGKDIVAAVKHGEIWLNLRRAGDELFDLEHVASTIFDSLETASGQKVTKRDMGLLISSPNVEVNYHLDIPMVSLFQLRGQKRVWLYPRDEQFAPSSYIEEIVHMAREEDLPYRAQFDDQAMVFDLKPGMGLTWPQLAPHRVQNANCMNVSLSCEFQTMKSLVNANAAYTNGLLRQNMKLSQKVPNSVGPLALGKAAFAQVHKKLNPQGPRTSPTPITFELDMSKENCVRSLWG
ncbi:MAG: hypothetical protein AAF996_07230 [Pseudomonadota bacterium]